MFDTRIEILKLSEVRDEYNERHDEYTPIAVCYASRTESGGRENLYAGRIVHENEIVYTIRFREDIKAGMFVRDGTEQMPIISVHSEGRRWRLHIKCTKSDGHTVSFINEPS